MTNSGRAHPGKQALSPAAEIYSLTALSMLERLKSNLLSFLFPCCWTELSLDKKAKEGAEQQESPWTAESHLLQLKQKAPFRESLI